MSSDADVSHPGAGTASDYSGGDGTDAGVAGRNFEHELRWFAHLFILSMLLSLVYYASHVVVPPPGTAAPAKRASPCAQNNLPCMIVEFLQQRGEALLSPHPADECVDIACLSSRLHPAQTKSEAVFKSLIVIVLSMLWFRTFTLSTRFKLWSRALPAAPTAPVSRRRQLLTPLHEWKPQHVNMLVVALSLIPAIFFALSMVGVYEPSVLVMALTAIYVAAEHYCTLETTQEKLEATAWELRVSARRNMEKLEQTGNLLSHDLSNTKDRLEATEEKISSGVSELEKQVHILLNADGLALSREKLYAEYRQARERIDAVVRHFDIDEVWWRCREDDPWGDYLEQSKKAGSSSFLNVLTDQMCTARILFVSDLPMPTSAGASQGAAKAEPRAQYFRNLMGLAWQLAVLAHVREWRKNKKITAYVRVVISDAPSWMHVVGTRTFQIIERGNLSHTTIRSLECNVTANQTDTAQIRLSDWARRNVRQFAFRGCSGEEYLLATLSYAARLAWRYEDEPLSGRGEALGVILNKLGLDDYLKSNDDFSIVEGMLGDRQQVEPDDAAADSRNGQKRNFTSGDMARKYCMAVFQAFLTSADLSGNIGHDEEICVRDLARNLL